MKLDEMERRLLVEALERVHGNQSQAAELLGLSRHQVRTRMKRHGLLVAFLMVASAALGVGAPPAQAQRPPPAATSSLACLRCHGSREFLEQAAPSGTFRPSLVVGRGTAAGAAHAALACVSCHVGATRFPHGAEAATPIACTGCHPGPDSVVHASVHGAGNTRAACTSCHGAHDVKTAAWLRSFEGRAATAQACARCHPSQLPDARDVHGSRATCTDCHGSHAIRPVRDPRTRGVALATARRCATCHAREAAAYWADAHGTRAVRDAASRTALGRDTAAVVPGVGGGRAGGAKDAGDSMSAASGATCVDCHRGHAVRNPADTAAHFAFAETCTHCHAAYGATFRENYHGQATQVGSERAALCADCHTAHSIYAASDSRSSVAAQNRLTTCRRCHLQAAGLFAEYRPHADPRSGSPGLFAVWLAMTLLLGALTLVYVVHAALVSRRTLIERRSKP